MKTANKAAYDSLEDMCASAADMVRPPDRISVSQAAEKYRWIENQGNYVGPYKNELTPYNVEVQDILTSQEFTAGVFVGPAQCAKTEPVMNWVTYSGICDPADMMIVSPTNVAARDFSKRRLQRLYRDTEELRRKLIPGRNNTNVFDTQFKNGMLLTLSHPSIAELSGKPIPRLWLTDFDRMDENIDGEGNAFDLSRKRATTFRRFGMCFAESSPGFVIENPKWIKSKPHEAPPTKGILALYNRGDMRRWFWRCIHCDTPFEPDFKLMRWPDEGDDLHKSENATMECPHCMEHITHDHKHRLNLAGRWIKNGQRWEKDGSISGVAERSEIASFWIKGPAAAFATWQTIVFNYLKALEDYEKTGSEESLKATVNTDQGDPYTPQAMMSTRLPEDLKARAENWGGSKEKPVVPDGVRYLVATVDVQAGLRPAFVVHVYGFGVGGDVWHIDMFKIRKSNRKDGDNDPEWIDPAAYPEDWQVLVPQVLQRTYPLNDDSGRYMQMKLVGCDSGGKEGVTTNAYNFWRWLRDEETLKGLGLHNRFQLLKGDATRKNLQRYVRSFPDAQRKDRKAGARGDVPVGFINSNTMKDTVFSMLGRAEPGGGKVHFPFWAEDWLYMQLTSEVRTAKGWENKTSKRNEAFDLLYYAVSLGIDERIRAEMIDWTEPPGWADVWDRNDLVVMGPDARFTGRKRPRKSLKQLAEEMT